MDPERWHKVEELYSAALECDSKDRAALLNRHEPELRREVEILLAHERSRRDRPTVKVLPDNTVTVLPPSKGLSHQASVPAADLFEARFLPGTILAQRYRIVNLLGRGGMGEVYRAMDLMLGQTVALKFLPEGLANQIQARERLFNEVRAAREITHPQVCRIHDVGEMDGQLYISMEFVDGEDLASLLSRIGRLPAGKASELAAGICAGLAAAHRSGLVHRDLKPANIMVDGRGQPRLMDFGLAAGVGTIAQSEVAFGTPMYMAPEQLAGKEVTVRSDLYALGLILYELFTGQRPFEGKSMQTLLTAREKNAPNPISTHCPEVTPGVENIVASCLSPDPARRPASAHAVAAALPYKDALAAVLAAGDTPSPELIAASGDAGRLRPVVAYGVAAAILGALISVYLLKTRIAVNAEQPPEVLANSANTLARQLLYTAKPAATAYGFITSGTLSAPKLRFWYRESETELQAALIGNFVSAPGRVTPSDPPLEPGMRFIEMDPRGQLIRFTAIPRSPPAANLHVDWKPLLNNAGLDVSQFTEVPAVRLPIISADNVLRWAGQSSPQDRRLVVTAASWMGQAVYFQVIDETERAGINFQPLAPAAAILLICAVLAAFFFARRNLKERRGDHKGAFRVGSAMFWICATEWMLVARHSFTVREAVLASFALSWALAMAVLAYLCYVAIDPTVRRFYPEKLISLQTVLTGGRRDSLLGRDILVGLGIAVAMNLYMAGFGLGWDRSGLTPRALAGIWVRDLRIGVWIGMCALAFILLFGRRRNRKMRLSALGIIAETGVFCLRDIPPVPDASGWYAQAPLLGYTAFAVLTIYAARLAAGSGPSPGGVTQV